MQILQTEKVNKMHEGKNKIRMGCENKRHKSTGRKCKGEEKIRVAESATERIKCMRVKITCE